MDRRTSRSLVAAATIATLVLWVRASDAEAESVPIGLQVQLLAKVASYDRNLPARANGRVRVAVVTKPGNAESERASAQLVAKLRETTLIGGLPHDDVVVKFTTVAALAASCASEHFSVVYFAPGFQDDLAALRAAFNGVNVLTVASVASYVPAGVVLGFDTVSAKPKLLFHVTQARSQNIAMSTEVVRLMTVFE